MTDKDPIASLEKISAGLVEKAMKAVKATAARMQEKLVKEQLSGPTSDSTLSRHTANLARSIQADDPKQDGNVVSATLHAGVIYAKTHFGPRGSAFQINSKGKKLAIPLDAAKTGAGVARGSPLDGIWGPTKIFRSKAGNMIIWGYQVTSKSGRVTMGRGLAQKKVTGGQPGAISLSAASKMQSEGELIPLFVLKDSVVIKRRIDPKVDLVDWGKPVLIEELKKVGLLKAG